MLASLLPVTPGACFAWSTGLTKRWVCWSGVEVSGITWAPEQSLPSKERNLPRGQKEAWMQKKHVGGVHEKEIFNIEAWSWICPDLSYMPKAVRLLPVPAAAAAKSLQSCLTLCDPIDGSPSGSTIPRILQARTLERVAISFSNAWKWKVKVKSLSRVQFLVTPWTAAYQAPLSMGFSKQEYWSGVPLPSPLPVPTCR